MLAVTVCLLATPNPILIVCYLNLIRTRTFICSTLPSFTLVFRAQVYKILIVLKPQLLVDIGEERTRPLSVEDQSNPGGKELREGIKKRRDVHNHHSAGSNNLKPPPS